MTAQERFAYQKALIKYRMAAQITEDLEREAAEAHREAEQVRKEIKQREQEAAQAQEEIKQREQEAARAWEEIKQREQEAARAKKEAIVKMLSSGLLSDEQIAEFQNVPLSQV